MIHSPFEPGNFDFIWGTTANPAVATDLTVTVPPNARSELAILSFLLACDANVADRYITILANDGASINILGGIEFPLTANQVRPILVGPSGFSSIADSGLNISINIQPCPFLLETFTIVATISNMQAGDQISTVRHLFKTWIYEQ